MNKPEGVKRDYEVSVLQRIPSVTLKFNWSIKNYNVEKKDGCESPEIELPDVTLSFMLQGCFIPANRVNYEVLRVRSNSLAIFLTGKISINGTPYNISIRTAAKEEVLLKVLELKCPDGVEVVFDLKVFYLAKKNVLVTKKNYEANLGGDGYSQQLLDYVQTLFRNQQFSDVRIDVGGESIAAHKNILSARSPVFQRMFQNVNVAENTENVVNVVDISYEVMERLIGFLYGYPLDLDSVQDADLLCSLYFASDKYEVLHLRDMCGLALVDRMTPDTASQLVELFDHHADSEMVKLVIKTCCMHLNTTSERDEWREAILSKPKLTALVLGKLTEA